MTAPQPPKGSGGRSTEMDGATHAPDSAAGRALMGLSLNVGASRLDVESCIRVCCSSMLRAAAHVHVNRRGRRTSAAGGRGASAWGT
eukprot:2232306-Prymnesium_polylepis.2